MVVKLPAPKPKKALEVAVVLNCPANDPKKALSWPVVFACPADMPKKALSTPLLLIPALIPAYKLLDPAAINSRCPPRLYCVVALTRFEERVPPAVPSPLMLKLDAAC